MANEALAFYRAVREDMQSLLREQRLSADFSQALQLALESDGKVLSPNPRSKWPLLAIVPCWGAGADWRNALPAATAAELVGLSSDLFDEIEDGDDCPIASVIGIPRAVNVASALLALAGRSLSRTPASVSGPLWSAILLAADGQHQDLGAQHVSTPEQYLALVDRKSAQLVSAFCSAGARLAGVVGPDLAGYDSFGLHLGRLAQLANDLHDLWPQARGKRDLERRLVTLPIIFVLRGPDNPFREQLSKYLASCDPLSPSEDQELRDLLLASGALHYTWLMAETSRSAAIAALREVCQAKADAILALLLPPLTDIVPSPTS